MAACAWFSVVAILSAAAYERLDDHQGWWSAPSFDSQRYSGPYLRVYKGVRGLIKPGALIAYNQAGFVPYMLDADNIDDLGICSRFIARMPTKDVIFTQTGRYSPLTNAAALRTANAYLLYRSPDYVIAPIGNLRAANRGAIPHRILRNHYVKLLAVPHAPAVLYGRSPRAIDGLPAVGARVPRESRAPLTHPLRLERWRDSGRQVSGRSCHSSPRARWIWTFSGRIRYDIVFARTNEPAYELDVEGIWVRTDVTMVLTLWTV